MWYYIVGGILLLIFFLKIKHEVWDLPHEKIQSLSNHIQILQQEHQQEVSALQQKHQQEVSALQQERQREVSAFQQEHQREVSALQQEHQREVSALQQEHQQEVSSLKNRLEDSSNILIQKQEFDDIIECCSWKEEARKDHLIGKCILGYKDPVYKDSVYSKKGLSEYMKARFHEAIEGQYKYRYITFLYPELERLFNGTEVLSCAPVLPEGQKERSESVFEIVDLLKSRESISKELILLKNRVKFLQSTQSNLSAIPYMAAIMADYETYGLEHLASQRNWGYAAKRMDKVKSIREIRKDAQAMVEKNKDALYQLEYLLRLFPNLQDIIETDYRQLPVIDVEALTEYDTVHEFLSKEEYQKLSTCERNQLALDRYRQSHKRTKWQIGRDYEYYVGYRYRQKGYDVDFFGSYMGFEDLGRDIIAKKGNKVLIIQCKYWSAKKKIHECHINQLYGTMTCYRIEHALDFSSVEGLLITNIELSPMAKKMASYLGINFVEHFEAGDYPCIKCNIGRNQYGEQTKIYHLPFDQQYDVTKIQSPGEFYAMTVREAEAAGFRRTFKWHGNT